MYQQYSARFRHSTDLCHSTCPKDVAADEGEPAVTTATTPSPPLTWHDEPFPVFSFDSEVRLSALRCFLLSCSTSLVLFHRMNTFLALVVQVNIPNLRLLRLGEPL